MPGNKHIKRLPAQQAETLIPRRPANDAASKLKSYIQELDIREQEIISLNESRADSLLQRLATTDDTSWTQIAELLQAIITRKQQAFLQDMHSSNIDYEERLMMQQEKLQVEVRMWELREQDLQEQFAFREQQIKLQYEGRIRELEEQLKALSGPRQHLMPEFQTMECPVSLGIDVAEERSQLYLTKEPIKVHPGVRVTVVDPLLRDSHITVGDVVTKVSFTVPINSSADYRKVVSKVSPGDLVMMHVEKDGAERVYPIIAGGLSPAR